MTSENTESTAPPLSYGDFITRQYDVLRCATFHYGQQAAYTRIIEEITHGTCMSCHSPLLNVIEELLNVSRRKVEKNLPDEPA